MEDISEIDAQCNWVRDRLMEGEYLLPPYMFDGVVRYVVQGIPPGDFMKAVFCNDLKGAVGRADDQNKMALADWVIFMVNYMPSVSQGSPERYENWIKSGGYRGQYEKEDS